MTTKQNPKGVEPPTDVQDAVKALIREVGEEAAAAKVELSAQTLARLAGGMKVNRSTIGVVRFRLGLRGAS